MSSQPSDQAPQREWRLVVHGGCGIIERGTLTAEQDAGSRAALHQALEAGAALLDGGGSALDAVEAAVRILEDDPHFNAGRGAVFTYEGKIEHDAAIMEGATRCAGAVAGTSHTRHPISLARRVMENSPHVFLRGLGADQFSEEQGLEQVSNEWFHIPERRRQLEEFRKRPDSEAFDIDLKYGTVGAVAVDRNGSTAAATSTGGLTGKRWGRIGDSPIIGAGTYADDRAGAVSATGAGEYFIREGVAHEICARLRFTADTPQQATDTVMAEMRALGGTGGVILVTPAGDTIYSFNTPGMYRGEASPVGRTVAIYGDE
jgi:beta-aspartyl-peptidase (threonine type)